MYLNNYKYLKNKTKYLIIFLFLFSFLIRIPSIFLYGDQSLQNEWMYLVEYLVNYNKLYSVLPSIIDSSFNQFNFTEFLPPNIFMPPLYAFYLYFFKFFNLNIENYILVILFSQSILSSMSVVIFYKINRFFFLIKSVYLVV